MADVNEIAGVVALAIKAAMGQYQERVAVLEAELKSAMNLAAGLTELRDRVVVAETKATLLEQRPAPVLETKSVDLSPDLADIRRRVDALEQKPAPDLWPPIDVTPLTERITALEQRPVPDPADVVEARKGLAALEMKSIALESSARSLQLAEAAITELTRDMSTLRERVAVVEVRPPVPGPPGPAGKDGAPGRDGKDGSAGLEFEGVYQEGQTYEKGQMATWAGSMWHCNETTAGRPGESKAWTLCVKKGRDGKDGKDAPAPLPVVSVKG